MAQVRFPFDAFRTTLQESGGARSTRHGAVDQSETAARVFLLSCPIEHLAEQAAGISFVNASGVQELFLLRRLAIILTVFYGCLTSASPLPLYALKTFHATPLSYLMTPGVLSVFQAQPVWYKLSSNHMRFQYAYRTWSIEMVKALLQWWSSNITDRV